MHIEQIKVFGSWADVADAARVTVGKKQSGKMPPDEWKAKMLTAEHSPLRMLLVSWTWGDLPSWVSVHYVRHKIGVEHFVQSQRSDRTSVNRDELPQNSLVNHKVMANVQAILNMARKRLCNKSAKETRLAFNLFLDALSDLDPFIASACKAECAYRGWCPEIQGCNLPAPNIEVYSSFVQGID
jgi:hypothetical protein